jgi:hypothetical protein
MAYRAQTVGTALAGILIGSVFALAGAMALFGALPVLWLAIETKGRVLEEIAA